MKPLIKQTIVVIAALAGLATATVLGYGQNPSPAAPTFKTRPLDPILELGSPDGKWAIYRKEGQPRAVWLRDLTKNTDRLLITFPSAPIGWKWSLDGKQLACLVFKDVHIVDIATGADHTLELSGWPMGWTKAGEVLVVHDEPASGSSPSITTHVLVSPSSGVSRVVDQLTGRASAGAVGVMPAGDAVLMQGRGRLFAHDIAANTDRDIVRMPRASNPVVSPDGRWLAFFGAGGVYAMSLTAETGDARTRPVRVMDLDSSHDGLSMWWLTDGSLAVSHVVQTIGNLYRVDMDPTTGRARGPMRLFLRDADYPAVSPDSKEVAHTTYTGGKLGVVSASGGVDHISITDAEPGSVFGWRSPSVVFVTAKPGGVTIDIKTRTQATLYSDNTWSTESYSPTRDEVLGYKSSGSAGAIIAFSLASHTERTVVQGDGVINAFRMSSDGKSIAYGRRQSAQPDSIGELHVATFDGRDDRIVASWPSQLPWPVAWSPDDKFILYGRWGELYVLDLKTAASTPLLADIDHPVFQDQASWSPDGSFVILGAEANERNPIGKVFEGVGSTALQAPQSAQPSGSSRTRITLLGTGNPVADPDRFGPAVAITVDDQVYIVDAGVGVVRRAAAAGIMANRLARVFLTHLHSDHTLGLPDLMLSPWVLNRPAPLEVYGPAGTAAMTQHIEAAWREDIAVRANGMEPKHAGADAYRANTHEIGPGRVYEDKLVKVDAIAVPHGTFPAAFGYRFETPDRVIVISGDTKPTAKLVDACNGCDVLIHEVYSAAAGRGRSAEWQAYDAAFHTSTVELAEIAKAAHPRLLVLYHNNAAGPQLEREIAQAGYTGRVIAGKDLDVY